MGRACCFTGYRPEKFSFSLVFGNDEMKELEEKIYNAVFALVEEGFSEFYCGMASGFDLLCGKAVVDIKRTNPEKAIKLLAAIPYRSQSNGFSNMWKKLYDIVLHEADESRLISEEYSLNGYDKRNRLMVDNSSAVICYFDGKSGGTANTVKYALKKGRRIINLADYEIEGADDAYQLEFI